MAPYWRKPPAGACLLRLDLAEQAEKPEPLSDLEALSPSSVLRIRAECCESELRIKSQSGVERQSERQILSNHDELRLICTCHSLSNFDY